MESFEMVFRRALISSPEIKKKIIDRSVLWEQMMRAILLTYVSSISSKDRLVYFQHVLHSLNPNLWKGKAWDAFIKTSFAETLVPDVSEYPSWAHFNGQKMFGYLKQHNPELMDENFESPEWKSWSVIVDPYSNCPVNVTDEDRLLLIKTFLPHNLNTSLSKYCCNKIGIQSLNPVSDTLSQHWHGYLNQLPLPVMLISERENDPGNEIKALAESMQLR